MSCTSLFSPKTTEWKWKHEVELLTTKIQTNQVSAVRVLADGQTDWQTQTDFIICPMLYAIATGRIAEMVDPQCTDISKVGGGRPISSSHHLGGKHASPLCTVQRFQFYSIIFVMWSTPRIGPRTDHLPSVHGRPTWDGSLCGRHTDLWILCSWWSFCSSAAHLHLCHPCIRVDEGEPPATEHCKVWTAVVYVTSPAESSTQHCTPRRLWYRTTSAMCSKSRNFHRQRRVYEDPHL